MPASLAGRGRRCHSAVARPELLRPARRSPEPARAAAPGSAWGSGPFPLPQGVAAAAGAAADAAAGMGRREALAQGAFWVASAYPKFAFALTRGVPGSPVRFLARRASLGHGFPTLPRL